jgi:hypothetical protein
MSKGKTIFKYVISISGTAMALPKYQEVKLTMPSRAEILTAQMQGDELVLWALVNPNIEHTEVRVIEIFATGSFMSELKPAQKRKYITTFQIGWFVGHVFELC